MQKIYRNWAQAIVTILLLQTQSAHADTFVDRIIERIDDSNISFDVSDSNAPFVPVSFLGFRNYGSTEVENSNGTDFEYDLSTVSQMALVPVYVGENDIFVIGNYASWSRFEMEDATIDDFEVGSFGLAAGWLRQVNPNWQVIAFTMPYGHFSTIDDSGWSGELMSGAFARYVQNDSLWWAFGMYSDLNPVSSYAIPYLGAMWTLSPEWTLNMIMPWPSVIYAPNQDWLFSLGIAPSGASWAIESDQNEVYYNLDAWDLGFSIERRLHKSVWLAAKTGLGGLRGLRINGSGIEEPEYKLDSSWFFGLTLNIRP